MKFRICVIAVVLIASAALAVRPVRISKAVTSKAVRLSQQEQVVVKTQEAIVKIFNNTIDGRWINVPIEITSLGGHNYRLTNKTHMGIRRFIIALYAPYIGKPFRGEGAVRRMVQVRIMDKPTIEPGKSIDINIEENLKEFGGSQHQPAADMYRIEMILYVVDFADENHDKRWFGGKYLRLTINNEWDLDPDLNPKEDKDLIGVQLSPNSASPR